MIESYEEIFIYILLDGMYTSKVLVKGGVTQEVMIEGIKQDTHIEE